MANQENDGTLSQVNIVREKRRDNKIRNENGHCVRMTDEQYLLSAENLIGAVFTRLTVEDGPFLHVCPSGQRKRKWLCRCSCGNTSFVQEPSLKKGGTKSCGCYDREAASKRLMTHGEARERSKTREYTTWLRMKSRCHNPCSEFYQFYGGRGITVCERWINSYENFLADMGRRPKGTTIDRINNDGNYEPGNCRWATPTQQANNKSNNVIMEHNGEAKSIAQWEKSLGFRKNIIWDRLNRGESFDYAISRPPRGYVWTDENKCCLRKL
jgi:hypothetical protein